jgi:hypothetical protein
MIAVLSAGCVTAVPGAEKVKITRNPADVSGCAAVGNITAEAMNNLDPLIAQNQAIGLNANVVFNTGAGGVAYRCSKTAAQ